MTSLPPTTPFSSILHPSGWLIELRHALRRLRRRPGYAGASILTLALGIAASTSVFALVHGVLLSPLPYPASDRIVDVDHAATGLGLEGGLGITYGFFRFYEERIRAAESMAMYGEYGVTLAGAGEPTRVRAVRATPSLARVLGVDPVLGRWFTDDEGGPGEPQTVLLSHGLWRERFGENPAAIGGTVLLDGVAHEVVGVMPASFAFPAEQVALWTPRRVPPTGIGGWNERAVARLAPGATSASMSDEMVSALPLLRELGDDPGLVGEYLDNAGAVPRIRSLKEAVVGEVSGTLWILLGAVGFVLLVAVANVANLFLVPAEEGAHESGLREALGAGRWRIVRGFLSEALFVAGTAAALGVALAAGAVAVVRSRAPVNIPRLREDALDPTVLAVAASVALAAWVALGIAPAVRSGRDIAHRLKEDAGRTTEIGLRIAMGARASDIRATVLRQSGGSLVLGASLGLVAASGLSRLITSLLYGVSATDPPTYVAAALMMICVGGIALWIPARRASRVDPAVAMRAD